MKLVAEFMEKRSTAIILIIVLALPLSIIVGALRDFHWGYLTYCTQCVLLMLWRTLHDGKPRSRLHIFLIIAAIIHAIALVVLGAELRTLSSFAITLIFMGDFVITSWLVGSQLAFDGGESDTVRKSVGVP